MPSTPASPVASAGPRRAPMPNSWAAQPRLHVTLETLLLTLLATLLGRPRAALPAWHPAPISATQTAPKRAASTYAADTHAASTHADYESPILFVIGPGPNPGLHPRPRATPTPRPRTARAPPLPRRPHRPHAPNPGVDNLCL